jgi:hypothetical protein
MRLTDKQMNRLVSMIFTELKAHQIPTFKVKEEVVHERAVELLREDYRREGELDQAVEKMMDELEGKNPGEFQRYKMFPLLKKRLAKEKGIIL